MEFLPVAAAPERLCPRCLRTERQHGSLTCERIDGIAARVAFGLLPWWRRLGRRLPEDPARVRAALPPVVIDMPSPVPSPGQRVGEGVA